MKVLVLLATVTLLSGCGGISKVVRAGADTYMVSSGGGMYEQNPSGIREEVYEAANADCDGMGRRWSRSKLMKGTMQLGDIREASL